MLPASKSPWSVLRRTLVGKLGSSQCARFKSENTYQRDDFPYRHLSQRDVSSMSAAMESTTRLPLRTFFAQHRPLMPFAKPLAPAHENELMRDSSNETRWVHVPVTNGRFPIFMADERSMWNVLPENVAKQLGPFNRDTILHSKYQEPQSKKRVETHTPSVEPLTATELQSVLSKKFPILMEHLQKMANSDGEVQFIPLTFEKMQKTPDEDEGVEATSVRRKRKLKMNRHKYRKRLKEQRTKRRRLGK